MSNCLVCNEWVHDCDCGDSEHCGEGYYPILEEGKNTIIGFVHSECIDKWSQIEKQYLQIRISIIQHEKECKECLEFHKFTNTKRNKCEKIHSLKRQIKELQIDKDVKRCPAK